MKKVLITGVAGFLGSNLANRLIEDGMEVWGLDNFSTGREKNISAIINNPNFNFIKTDIINPLPPEILALKFDLIYNLACPASPPKYQSLAIETMEVSSVGLENIIKLALKNSCRMLHSSTSEVYGDPLEHPQKESYWGNVNSYGARSMYDEGKRFAEALIWVYQHQKNLNAGIVRIFNTYGPNMDPNDGRVVSNFITQALKNEPLTIYGDGKQTRSYCYINDEIDGIIKLVESNISDPVNIGNSNEFSVLELAKKIIVLTNSNSRVKLLPSAPDDPKQRQPDIAKAKSELGWEPKVELDEGLRQTIEYFRGEI